MVKLELQPYKSTDVPWERSKGEITSILMEHGVSGVQWTDIFERNEINLRFSYRLEHEGKEDEIGVQIIVPIRMPKKKDRWGSVLELTMQDRKQVMNQAYRALYWWMKSQWEAIAFGIQRFEQVFLSQILYKLPNGRFTTVLQAIGEGKLLEGGGHFALEAPQVQVEVLPPEKKKEEIR